MESRAFPDKIFEYENKLMNIFKGPKIRKPQQAT